MMNRIWLVCGMIWFGAVSVLAQSIPIKNLDGGGAIAQSSSLRLIGAVNSYGLPNGQAGKSSAGAITLRVGYYPSLVALLLPKNSTNPIWLEVVRWLENRRQVREEALAQVMYANTPAG